MKKALILVALSLFGTSLAVGTVTVTVNATVSNVCVFSGTSNDISGGNTSTISLNYNAKDGGDSNGTAYTIQCTSGTNFTSGAMGSGNLTLNSTNPGANSTTLETTFTDNLVSTPVAGAGDSYSLSVSVSAAPGQWDTKGDTYTGDITYTVDYN